MNNIKEKIEEIVKTLANDKELLAGFKKDPISTIEKLIGVDLPNEQIEAIVAGVKAKISLDDLKKIDDVGDVLNLAGKLFGKKG